MADFKQALTSIQDKKSYQKMNWEGTFEDYIDIVKKKPEVTRNAFQRLYDMILSYGTEKITYFGEEITKYNFFTSAFAKEDAIYGLEKPLNDLMNVFKGASEGFGPEKRIIILHGPVGSSKSTIVRLIKRGLENYSRTDDGALYTFDWEMFEEDRETDVFGSATHRPCPMNEEPLHLIQKEQREKFFKKVSLKVNVKGDLCPFCRYYFNRYIKEFDGDIYKVLEKVKVRRLLFSEVDRRGIGTFQPKDEKNQDSTELTGEGNYRLMAKYGSDADPRAFDFNGEFNISNRGLLEFIEVLKLDVAFLYDLLGASQEHCIKPRKFAQTEIDEVIIGHTNPPEQAKMNSDQFMEAFRDRTIKVDIPYVINLSNEIKIYEKDFSGPYIAGKHICPHTSEIAAMWSILTRLTDPDDNKLTIIQKMRLYSGKSLPGYTEESIKTLRQTGLEKDEGMTGISPRYIQDKLSNALVKHTEKCINPYMVLNELEAGLQHHSLVTNDEQRKRYKGLLSVVKEEYEDVLKNEFQKAVVADETAITNLCSNYIDNVKAYTQGEKVKNDYTGEMEEPNENLMRSIEEKADVEESRKDEFRQSVMNYIGALAVDGKKFDFTQNERLYRALELKVFEDQKDTIKLKSIISSVVDDDSQKKIDVIKQRMVEKYGYCNECATATLKYIASIFARGDTKQKEKEE